MGNEKPYGFVGNWDSRGDLPSIVSEIPIWRHLRKDILPPYKISKLDAFSHYPSLQPCRALLALQLGVQPLTFLFQPCSCLSKRERKRLDYRSPFVARRNK